MTLSLVNNRHVVVRRVKLFIALDALQVVFFGVLELFHVLVGDASGVMDFMDGSS